MPETLDPTHETNQHVETLDCVVIGAGVVGLAVARELALAGREVMVLEAAEGIGTGTSSRNSEVIHAGIYYAAGSLKARLCVEGRRSLYAYCEARGVPHRRCGKLIVATDAGQHATLQGIRDKADANGLLGEERLQWLDASQAQTMEPALACTAALWSPSTGIIDSHALMLALQGDAEGAGALFAFHSAVRGARVTPQGIALEVADLSSLGSDTAGPPSLTVDDAAQRSTATAGDAAPLGGDALARAPASRWLARTVINCAGLHAPALAASILGLDTHHVPRGHLARGHYFTLSGRAPFQRLVYPVPEPGGLGVHLTLDLGGQARFGPDVQWVDTIDYTVDAARGEGFYQEVRRYWPGLPDGALQPGYAGIRPKIAGPEAPNLDFRIDGPAVHGIPGLVNLFGIESPGLTACLAIATAVRERLDAKGAPG